MKRKSLFILSLLSSIIVLSQSGSSQYPFNDSSVSTQKRVDDLVSRMTLVEKIGQMQHTAPAIGHLGIPAYNWWNECLHGVARNGIATVFPQAIGLAATWNTTLVHQEADVISTEGRAKFYEAISKNKHDIYQGLTFWSPNINIFRDPRWGRGQETYGEDPFLTAQIGTAFVKGLQGDNPKYFKVIATAKHFAVHSGPEPERHVFDAWPSEKDLYETYLPAFESLVKDAKVYSVMGAYNRLYGTPCCASDLLLEKTLRGAWGFDGYVVSDCWAVSDFYRSHKFVPDAIKASSLAVKTGTDLACGEEYSNLIEGVANGFITEAEIDIAVKRLFTARIKLGLFDPPSLVPYSSIKPTDYDTEQNRLLAREVAQQSIVLLKNDKSILPINKKIRSIAVIGPYANEVPVLLGNYNGIPSHPVTILQGIKNRAGKIKISYAVGTEAPENSAKDTLNKTQVDKLILEAVTLAQQADLVVFVGGISPDLEGEEMPVKVDGFKGGDRTNLDMPHSQQLMLEKLQKLGKPIVFVMTNGSALSVNWAQQNIPAILDCWYPGEEGGNAVADVLFGDYNPAGRLPVTFYKSVNDLPSFEDYSMKGRTYRYFKGEPLYAFGYGLSYTGFEYSALSLDKEQVLREDKIKMKVKVSNTGHYDGDEVIQVYFKQPESVTDKPIQSLIAFQRVSFKKGEQKEITFEIPVSQLRYFDTKLGSYAIAKGRYELLVGAASDDIRKRTTVEVN